MESIEVEAKTIEDALKIALGRLGSTKDKVEVRILREPKKGLFGMEGAQSAKIKVIVKK